MYIKENFTIIYRILLISSCLLLTGCISLTAPKANTNYTATSKEQHKQQLSKITKWEMQGAFSLQSPQESQIANYKWSVQKYNSYQLSITSAMNLYSVIINRNQNSTYLINNKKQTITAATPEKLLEKTIGYSIPVSNLYYWSRGVAAPGANKAQYSDNGHLTQLDQDGWHIVFSKYTNQNNIDLPQTINLSRNDITIKLIVKNWKIQLNSTTKIKKL